MNRVWMITGAGRGLGRAFAEEPVTKQFSKSYTMTPSGRVVLIK